MTENKEDEFMEIEGAIIQALLKSKDKQIFESKKFYIHKMLLFLNAAKERINGTG
jgi:hypothetical protein